MSWSYASNVLTQANESDQDIDAVNSESGKARFTVTGHGYSTGDFVHITGTDDYDGPFFITDVPSANTFVINDLDYTSTDTGTVARGDGDLSGLDGLTGVSVAGNVYTIGATTKMEVTGTLRLVPEENSLVFLDAAGNSAYYPRMDIRDDAHFIFGSKTTTDKGTIYSKGTGITVLATGNFNPWDSENHGAFCQSSGNPVMEFYGGVIYVERPMSFGGALTTSQPLHSSGGDVTIEELTVRQRPENNRQIQVRFDSDVSECDVNVQNIRVHGSGDTIILYAEGFTNFSATLDSAKIQSYSGQLAALRLDDMDMAGNHSEFDLRTNGGGDVLFFVNSNTGSDTVIQQNSAPTTNCQFAFYGTALISAVDTSNNPVEDIKYYVTDVVGSNRVSPIGSMSTDYSTLSTPFGASSATVYTGTTDSNGEASITMLMSTYDQNAEKATAGTGWSDYSTGQSLNDDFLINMFGYQTNYASTTAVLRTLGGTPVNFFLIQDFMVTESDIDTVNAYTTLETSEKFYDRAKAHLYDNYAGETTVTIEKSGTTLDFGSRDVNLNSTGNAYAITSSAITANVGTTFTGSIVTTGTVTVNSSVTVIGSITDTNGTIGSITVNANDGDTIAYFLSDGTMAHKTTLSGSNTTNFLLTASQTGANQRVVITKSGFQSRTRIISTDGGGEFVMDFAALIQKQGPSGDVLYNASDIDSRVTVEFQLTDLTAVTSRIDIANVQSRAFWSFARFEQEKLSDNGLKYLAFGGAEPGMVRDPVLGDQLFLPTEIRLRRKATGDTSAGILATVYHADGTPIDDANGNISIVGGRVIDDFAEALLIDKDIDLSRAGEQSVASILTNIRHELVTYGVGAELTAITILPADTAQRTFINGIDPGDRVTLDSDTEIITVFSRVSDTAIILYLIGDHHSIGSSLTINHNGSSTTLISANKQTTETDISGLGHWAVRTLTIPGFMLDIRDRVDTGNVAIGASSFGDNFAGTWTVGSYDVDDVVWHVNRYYKCTVARTSSNTDNPSVDTSSWDITVGQSSGGSGGLLIS